MLAVAGGERQQAGSRNQIAGAADQSFLTH
jgi:hypothetical protein